MYLNFYCYLLFIPLIFISLLLSFTTISWFNMWMLMEINLISFIMLIIFEKNIKNEIIMNFFLVQCFSSYLFLFSFINLEMNDYFNTLIMIIMNLSILLKMGMPPFIQWYMSMLLNLTWMNLFLFTTIQKVIPLIILNNLININNLLLMKLNFIMLLMMSMICAMMNLNNLNLKMIMCFSSIIQMSWMIILMFFNEMMMMNYFMIYLLIMLNFCLMMNNFNIINLNQLNMMKLVNKFYYILFMMIMFSLSGIPPMFGFLMKWVSIQSMNKYLYIYLILLILSSLISMFFYIRIIFNSMMLNYLNMKFYFKYINFKMFLNIKLIYLNFFSISLILIYELI